MRRETTGIIACPSCFDGRYDIQNHPQNKPPPRRRELLPVPDGRGIADLTDYLATEAGLYLLTEDGLLIIVEQGLWTPAQTQGR